MKKSLLALAVLSAFAGAAQAQSAVTIYGVIDGGIRHETNVNGAGDSVWRLGRVTPSGVTAGSHAGTFNQNRLGFKGVEDLGGGMNAHFALENGFDSANGGLDSTNRLFQRTALVGIGSQQWGSLDLGRQYSVSFKTIGAYDPFNYKYVAIIPLAGAAAGNNTGNTGTVPNGTFGGTRFDNDVQYTGVFGPATVRAEYSFGEQAGSARNGSAYAVGTTFATGPFSVGGAYTQKKVNVSAVSTLVSFQDSKQWTVGASFTEGPFRVATGYIDERQQTGFATGDNRVKNYWAGLSYDVTPAVQLTGGFYRTKLDVKTAAIGVTTPSATTPFPQSVASAVIGANPGRRDLFIVGGTYALSKRTNLYAEVDHANLRGFAKVGFGGAQTQDSQNGVSLGVNHLF